MDDPVWTIRIWSNSTGLDILSDRRDRGNEVVADLHAAIKLQVQFITEQPRDCCERDHDTAADRHDSQVATRDRVPNCCVPTPSIRPTSGTEYALRWRGGNVRRRSTVRLATLSDKSSQN